MNKVVKKILNILIDIVVIFILVVSILTVMLSLTSKSSGIANIFGYAPLSVQSDSMSPTFDQGDLIISKVIEDEVSDLEVGEVITFPIDINGELVLNTHRIVGVYKDDNITYYKTQGDNNPEPDEDMQSSTSVRAIWTGKVIPGVGEFLSFMRTQIGFFVCVLLPMILFFVYEAIRVILNLMAYNREKAIEDARAAVDSSGLTDEQKLQAIEQYLAQQGITNQAQTTDSQSVQTPAEASDSNTDSQN